MPSKPEISSDHELIVEWAATEFSLDKSDFLVRREFVRYSHALWIMHIYMADGLLIDGEWPSAPGLIIFQSWSFQVPPIKLHITQPGIEQTIRDLMARCSE